MAEKAFSQKHRRGAVICGAYGMGNAGDDAVLAAICAALRRIDGDMPITVLARRPGETALRFGVEAVHPFAVLRWLRAMRRAALFLSGGGSLLQDVTSRRSLRYYLFTIRMARRRGCAVQLYGCGVGPLLREASRRRTAETLNACADVVTLRDEASLEALRALGVTGPRLLLAADPALSLPPSAGEPERAAGFVLREWPGVHGHIGAFAACARHVWETYRREPVFFCLAPGDRAPARAVCDRLEAEGVPCSLSVDSRRVGRMSLVLSMRLHGLVFALRDGVPAAGIGYDPKVDAFCAEAGFPCLDLGAVTGEALCALADEAVRLDGEALAAAAEKLRRRELTNGRAAAQLLEDQSSRSE